MNFRKAHFIGIAGKGMSATALLLKESGVVISGSDEGFYPPVSDYLKVANIAFAEGYKKENIPPDADIIVIGKNAKLVKETNEEVRAAFDSGKPVYSFPDLLRQMTLSSETILAVGSYGKSTCTALLSWCLINAGKDPSYFIGEVTRGLSAHAHRGKGPVFVLEGDEYPSSNSDARSKFLHYNAKNVLLTSATHDHINIFKTHAEYLAPFRALLASLPQAGVLVANSSEPYARALAEESPLKPVFYALDDKTHWHAADIRYGAPSTFDLVKGGKTIALLSTQLFGAHNIENIVGVSAMLLEKELISPSELVSGIGSFQGVKRRLELLSPESSVPVYEGFGSSYEKAKSAIAATGLRYPGRRLVIVFEPHTFTWRNRNKISDYDDVFDGAEKVLIFEPASQGAASHAQLHLDEIVTRVKDAGYDAEGVADSAQALHRIKTLLRPQDVVLILTSGDLGGLIPVIAELAEQEFPI